jgi:hypothetical protein
LSAGYTPQLFAFYPLHDFGWGQPGRGPEEICSCSKLHPGEFTLPQTSRPRGALLPHLFTITYLMWCLRTTSNGLFVFCGTFRYRDFARNHDTQISLAPYPVVSGLSSLNNGLVVVLRTTTNPNFTERLLLSAFILNKIY